MNRLRLIDDVQEYGPTCKSTPDSSVGDALGALVEVTDVGEKVVVIEDVPVVRTEVRDCEEGTFSDRVATIGCRSSNSSSRGLSWGSSPRSTFRAVVGAAEDVSVLLPDRSPNCTGQRLHI